MKKTKTDLTVFVYTFLFIVLSVWLIVTAKASAAHEKQIADLTRTNQELRADLEELKDDQYYLEKEQRQQAERLKRTAERVDDLEVWQDEARGQVSRIYNTLIKLTRKKTQEEQKEAEVAQTATEQNQTATWSSYEATEASEAAEASEAQPETPRADAAPDGLVYVGDYQLTAYEWTGNPCANGNYPTEGFTVASNTFPIGTRLYIEGIGERVVEDTGGMSGDVIDIYMGDPSECIQFGRQAGAVYVIE